MDVLLYVCMTDHLQLAGASAAVIINNQQGEGPLDMQAITDPAHSSNPAGSGSESGNNEGDSGKVVIPSVSVGYEAGLKLLGVLRGEASFKELKVVAEPIEEEESRGDVEAQGLGQQKACLHPGSGRETNHKSLEQCFASTRSEEPCSSNQLGVGDAMRDSEGITRDQLWGRMHCERLPEGETDDGKAVHFIDLELSLPHGSSLPVSF